MGITHQSLLLGAMFGQDLDHLIDGTFREIPKSFRCEICDGGARHLGGGGGRGSEDGSLEGKEGTKKKRAKLNSAR